MKRRLVKWIVGVSIVAVSIVYLNAFWAVNDPNSPFPPRTSVEINNMITDGASGLLQSASEAFLFMNEVEIASGGRLNFGAALQRVDLAAAKIEDAIRQFKNIIAQGKESGYDMARIEKLQAFPYGVFARENGLNLEIMNRVASYLSRGNVLGFYARHSANMRNLLGTLNRIRADLLAHRLSPNMVLWSLLHQYTETMMFGNYASLVFYQL